MSINRRGESGNVFFTLFGAVALVGVIGVATSSLMRGPVGTVVTLNQKAKADSQLQIAQKLVALQAAQRAAPDPGPDCDGDMLIEPMPADITSVGCSFAELGLTGGGCLPSTLGVPKTDPWGTMVGYCSWNHGESTALPGSNGTSSCAGTMLMGEGTGAAASDKTVLAVISAGPDREFQTTCGSAPAYVTKVSGSDDIVYQWTYEETAAGLGGGLWSLVSGDSITTDKDIEISTDATFRSGTTARYDSGSSAYFQSGSVLDFGGGGLMLLPTDVNSGPCNDANRNMLRVNTVGGRILQICHPTNEGGAGWTDIGGSGSTNSVAGSTGDIQFNSGGQLHAVSALNWDMGANRLTVGTGGTGLLLVDGEATIEEDLTVEGYIRARDGAEGTPSISFATNHGSGFFLDGNSIGTSIGGTERFSVDSSGAFVTGDLDTTGDVNVGDILYVSRHALIRQNINLGGIIFSSGTQPLTVGDDLQVTGSSNFDGSVTFDGSTHTQGTANATFFAVDGTASGTTITDGQIGMGLYGGTGLQLTTGGTAHLVVENDGDIGIGSAAGDARAALDVGGYLRLRPHGTAVATQTCSGVSAGSITYASGDMLLVCSANTGNWETIGTSGGGGGGGGSLWQRVNGAMTPQTGHSVDDFSFGTLTPGSSGSYMYFDKSSAAFRVGTVAGAQWGSPGSNSVAMGLNTTASAASTVALGENVTAAGDSSFAFGLGTSAGTAPQVTGASSFGIFMDDQTGINLSTANTMLLAGGNLVVDPNSPATDIAHNGLAIKANGRIGALQYCNPLGTECFFPADVASGVIGAPGNDRELTFNSGGRLWTDENLVFNSAGRLGVGAGNPVTRLDVNGTIRMNYGNESCNAATEGAIHYNSSTDQFLACRSAALGWQVIAAGAPVAADPLRSIQFNSGGNLAGNANFVFTSAGRMGLGTNAPERALHVNATDGILVEGGGKIEVANGVGTAILDLFGASDGQSFSRIVLGNNSYDADWSLHHHIDGRFAILQSGVAEPRLQFSSAGLAGFGRTPSTRLDVDGTLRIAYGGEACDTTRVGGIHYNSATQQFLLCRVAGQPWEAISAGSSTGASGLDRQIQFNSGGQLGADANFVFTSAGNLGLGLSAPITRLDVGGAIKMGYDGENCDATRIGGIRFISSQSRFEFCADASRGWEIVSLGTGVTQIDELSDARTDYDKYSMYLGLYAGTNATGDANTALGVHALRNDTNGLDNVAIGYGTMAEAVATSNNTAVGSGAMYNAYSGTNVGANTAVGYQALLGSGVTGNNSGTGNVALGAETLTLMSSGSNNVAVGAYAGNTLTTGSGNILIGMNVQAPTGTTSNYINIGDTIIGDRVSGFVELKGALKFAYTNAACDGTREGSIHYNSTTDQFLVCKTAGQPWEVLASGDTVVRFISLTDTPNSYAGQAQRLVRVNAGATGLEFTNQIIPVVTGEPAPTGLRLSGLDDVTTGTPANGNVLMYSTGVGRWVSGTPATGAISFVSLTDTPNAYTGQARRFVRVNPAANALEFSNEIIEKVGSIPAPNAIRLSTLGDVSLGTPANGNVLMYSAGISRWVSGTPSAGGALNFISLSDTPTTYVGQANRVVRVNAAANALEFSNTIIETVGSIPPPTGFNLGDLNNVSVPTPADGNVLMYSAGLSRWVAGTGGTGSGGGVNFWSRISGNNIFYNSGTTPRVGIGNNAPTQALDVTGIVRASQGLQLGLISGANPPTYMQLGDLSNVSAASPADGNVLMYSAGLSRWVAGTGGTGGGVNFWSRTTGDNIFYNSGSTPRVGIGNNSPTQALDVTGVVRASQGIQLGVVSGAAAPNRLNLSHLGDVDVTAPGGGNVLTFNSTSNKWVAAAPSSGATPGGSDRQIQFNDNGSLGGVTGFTYTTDNEVDVQRSNVSTAGTIQRALNARTTVNPSGNIDAGGRRAAFLAQTYAMNTNTKREVHAADFSVANGGAGAIDQLMGTSTYVENESTGGAIGSLAGSWTGARISGGSVTSMLAGTYSEIDIRGGSVAEAAAINILSYQTGGTVTNRYGILINVPTGTATNDWGIYQAGTQRNYLRGNLGINNTAPDVALDITGDIEYTGTITDVSDMRLKTDIEPLRRGGSMLDKLAQVDTYSFRMKNDPAGRVEYGVMAQELEEIFPLLVHTAHDEMGTKSVNYVGLIAPMIEATRELKAENDNLRAEIAALRAEREEFKTALNDLAADVKGLKAHTGYGINRAEISLWMVLIAIAAGSLGLLTGGIVRNRHRKAE